MMAPAHADHEGSYSITLNEINNSGGSGTATFDVTTDNITVKLQWQGLAETFNGSPYPHVQHIHIAAKGECPPPSADEDGNGIVDTVEGQPFYGEIGTTLSTSGDTSPKAGTDLKVAPAGSSTDYNRTFPINDATAKSLAAGTAVIVVHGLNPADLSQEAQDAKSKLVPSLPLAATTPALCGEVNAMPTGAPDTGAGSTSGTDNLGLLAMGGGLMAAAGVAFAYRRRGIRPVTSKG